MNATVASREINWTYNTSYAASRYSIIFQNSSGLTSGGTIETLFSETPIGILQNIRINNTYSGWVNMTISNRSTGAQVTRINASANSVTIVSGIGYTMVAGGDLNYSIVSAGASVKAAFFNIEYVKT
jgi:hypothetical protein